MNFLTIIPARGGSKGLKNKNILNFNGKPLIYWTLIAAKKSKYINEIIVSTDSKKIANICKKYNFQVGALRPQRLSKSNSLMHDVIKYELKKDNFEKKYDAIILLQPTSPLRQSTDIDKACEVFKKNKADSLVSVKKVEHTNNPESLFVVKKNFLKRINNISKKSLRQKKKNYYAPNGAAIYITKLSKVNRYILGGKISFLKMSNTKSIDIDTKYDFELAKIVKKNFKKLNKCEKKY